MEKTGEVRTNVTPCDLCSRPATVVVNSHARCDAHRMSVADTAEKAAAAGTAIHLKSFTEPLEEEVV